MSFSPASVIRQRNRERQAAHGITTPLADIPDEELIRTLVAHGQPRWAAQELRGNPQLRLAALLFWCDVQDAGSGDKAARQRVDYMRECWVRMRAEEIISDDPRRGYHGDEAIRDPAELL